MPMWKLVRTHREDANHRPEDVRNRHRLREMRIRQEHADAGALAGFRVVQRIMDGRKGHIPWIKRRPELRLGCRGAQIMEQWFIMHPVQNRVAGRGNGHIRCRRDGHEITQLVRNGCIAFRNRDDACSAARKDQLGCGINAHGQRVASGDMDKAREESRAARGTVTLEQF